MRHAKLRRMTSTALVAGLSIAGFAAGAAGANALWTGGDVSLPIGSIINGRFGLAANGSPVTPSDAGGKSSFSFDADVTLVGDALFGQLKLSSSGMGGSVPVDSWGYDCGGGVTGSGIAPGATSPPIAAAATATRTCKITVQTDWKVPSKRLTSINGDGTITTGSTPIILRMEQVR